MGWWCDWQKISKLAWGISRRAQHQWIARDIMHQSQGVYYVFVLQPISTSNSVQSVQSVVEYNPKDRNSPPVKGYRCGSSGAFLYCQRQLFCFVAFCLLAGQTRRVGMFKQANLLAWMNITTWLQGRKPRESNKLFDLFPPQPSVQSVQSVLE